MREGKVNDGRPGVVFLLSKDGTPAVYLVGYGESEVSRIALQAGLVPDGERIRESDNAHQCNPNGG